MTFRLLTSLVFCAALSLSICTALLADSPAKPTTNPAQKPPATTTTKPATPSADSSDYPSPAELMRKLREERERRAKMAKVAHFDLSEPIGERPAEFSLFGDHELNLFSLLERLHKASADPEIRSVLLTLRTHGLSLSQAQEVRDALVKVKKAGKPVFVYADTLDTTGYTIATGASDIVLLEGGELLLPGVGMEAMFAKGLLDWIGVKADYVQIGEYKGADEQFTRTAASDELRGEMKKLVDAMYEQIVIGIAEHRNIKRQVVEESIDEMIVHGRVAKKRGLVDHLADLDSVRELMQKKLGAEVALLPEYGAPPKQAIDTSNLFAMISSMMAKPTPPPGAPKPQVAVIYAEGVIVDGSGEGGLFGGGGVGSDAMRKAFRTASRDPNVKAIVIRIDSPGGSALASEVMWQAARRLAGQKPVYVSIGGMAASGGYYLACAGDKIYADNTAIVGSIGVVGGKFVLKDLFDKIGLKTETFSKGRNADLFSSNQPFSEKQRTMVTSWMKQTYEQFTDRVMTTRAGKIKDIDTVARGRIFIAADAKKLGMVDEIGGINDAIAAVAKKASLEPGAYEIKLLPPSRTLADYINGTAANDGPSASTALPAMMPKIEVNVGQELFKAIPAPLRRAAGQQLQGLMLLQDRPVILMSPYTITVR